jgi:enterochelin esterase family protein
MNLLRRFRSHRLLLLLTPLVLLLEVATPLVAGPLDDVYRLGPDSLPQEGVPKGRVVGPLTLPSQVFTNTTRHYWVYVPAQYDASKAAALMVFQDGHAFVSTNGEYRVPNVFDNLIHRREMPVTLGVFINPGRRPDQEESSSKDWGDRINNRPTEYNELNDAYARMIVDELLPALKKDYNLSDNPEDRAIGGASSGAICAFTVAWHRPDQFRKVLSTIGSVQLGADERAWPDGFRCIRGFCLFPTTTFAPPAACGGGRKEASISLVTWPTAPGQGAAPDGTLLTV